MISPRTTLYITLLATAALAAPSRPTDGLITSKAKLALWTTAGVRSTTVHVDTNDGVVTLYGKVPTEEMRTLAQKTAGNIDGVTQVQNLLQVVPPAEEKATNMSDRDTKALADQALSNAKELKNSSIKVKSVDKGVVRLTGEAKSYDAYLRAVALVDRVPGVKRVVTEVKAPRDYREDERAVFSDDDTARAPNRNGMGPNDDTTRNEGSSGSWDGRITMAVKMRLLTAKEVPSTEIRVDTEDGVVTLFGIVPTTAIKNEAGSQASQVKGVVRVDNNLEVVPTSMKKAVKTNDDDIKRDIALAFKGQPELKSVTTTVKNGAVQLKGKVPNGWEKVHAIRLARSVSGVRTVEEQLEVSGEQREN